jgi:sarcosine oxidase subunit beta
MDLAGYKRVRKQVCTMQKHFHTIVIGGGCLGVATATSLARRQRAAGRGKVCLVEKAVLGAGLSSRHSAIVRSANASPTAARLAAKSTEIWKDLSQVWGVSVAFDRVGAIWIGPGGSPTGEVNAWRDLENSMREAGVDFHAIDQAEANRLTCGKVRLDPDELYFFEPEVLQLEASDVLSAMQAAIAANQVELHEHMCVEEFIVDGRGLICGVKTNHGELHCDFVVNAVGGWSAELFAPMGLRIPVALEPVYAANWLISASDLPESLPIIADYVNLAYFRRWRGSMLHMHQPRERGLRRIVANFVRSSMNPSGADIIYDGGNYPVTQQQLMRYSEKVQNRFPALEAPIYGGGHVSYFDITPDLKFILGPDNRVKNLFHVLGAGQALKYAPIFGELIADWVLEGRNPDADLGEFSIARFADKPLREFWLRASPQPSENRL